MGPEDRGQEHTLGYAHPHTLVFLHALGYAGDGGQEHPLDRRLVGGSFSFHSHVSARLLPHPISVEQ